MTNPFKTGMTRATELTRSGKLQEATELIQSLLNGGGQAPTDEVINGEFTRLDEAAAPATEAEPVRRNGKIGAARTGLAETLRKIASGGMTAHGLTRVAPVEIPPGARFLSLTHASAIGSRNYRLYVPANRAMVPMPLVVMLHGCTQSPEDFAIGTGMNALAEEFGCLIAYPAQPSGANAQKCWNWFRPEDQGRDRGEPALLAGLTRDILRDHGADPSRVYIAGLSAGGAAAAIMAIEYPDLFTAVAVHSGLPVGAARDVPSAFAAMRSGNEGRASSMAVPTIVFHGLADKTVHPRNGAAVAAQVLNALPKMASQAQSGTSRGGRAYRRTRYAGPSGLTMVEHWEIAGASHAWSGGHPSGSYTDPAGPDASREMMRFFLQHSKV